jgi:HlyD family secretion protein
MSRKWIIIILALVAIAVIAAMAFGQRQEEGTRIFTTEAENRTIQETVSASGKIFPQTEVKISSDVSGEIVELYVEEGDSVVSGQLLARIDPDIYQSQVTQGVASVNSAKAQAANAGAQINTLIAQKEQIQAQLKNAQEIYKRNQELRAEGVISVQDLEVSEANLRALEANLRSATSNIDASRETALASSYQVKSSEATLSQLRTSLRRTTIYAPIGGVVSLLNVEQGERVVGTVQMAGTEMMRIANLNSMEVRVEVSENDVPSVKLGDKVEIEVDAYLGRKFIGTVTQIANSSTNAALAENVLNSDQVTNFEVRIGISQSSYDDLLSDKNPYPFRPGMSASTDILTRRVDGVLAVPIQCVTTRENEAAKDDPSLEDLLEVVFIVSGDTVRQITVTTDIQDDAFIQVTSGLEVGAQLVKGPYSALSRTLKEGEKVIVVEEDDFYNEFEK